MPGNSELGRNVKKRAGPYDRAEANVNRAQHAIRIGHDQVREVRVSEVSNIKASRN